jgi:hypothetical protein
MLLDVIIISGEPHRSARRSWKLETMRNPPEMVKEGQRLEI